VFSKERDSGVSGLSTSGQTHAVVASFLGWTLDAFDYFVVVFLIDSLATEFHVAKSVIIASLFITLSTRPIGAVIFGLLTDRFGRRIPLMANVVFFSVVELACGFSPNLTFFLIMRALYGIGMGGEWGIGASLAMESVPPRWRGILSGILNSGYSAGYLLAAVVARIVLPTWGWRPMFWLGGLPALLAFYINSRVPESEVWKQHRAPSTGAVLRIVASQWKSFLYLVFLMTFMMFLSHGTQDLYPDFLGSVHKFGPAMRSYMAILYNIGAIVGSIVFGLFSERLGRRFTMICALGLALFVIPLWAFGGSIITLAIGSFLMQAGVQGAWGIIPVHLSELSADETRGLVPGLSMQLGILIAAPTNSLQFMLHEHVGYQWALAGFEMVTIAVLIATIAKGKERKGRSFLGAAVEVGSP
jgi:SHS family lactate transporter-like MFS transporter